LKSLLTNKPDFKQNGTAIGAFGSSTCKAIEDAGFTLHIRVPSPETPSMIAGLDKFLSSSSKKK